MLFAGPIEYADDDSTLVRREPPQQQFHSSITTYVAKISDLLFEISSSSFALSKVEVDQRDDFTTSALAGYVSMLTDVRNGIDALANPDNLRAEVQLTKTVVGSRVPIAQLGFFPSRHSTSKKKRSSRATYSTYSQHAEVGSANHGINCAAVAATVASEASAAACVEVDEMMLPVNTEPDHNNNSMNGGKRRSRGPRAPRPKRRTDNNDTDDEDEDWCEELDRV